MRIKVVKKMLRCSLFYLFIHLFFRNDIFTSREVKSEIGFWRFYIKTIFKIYSFANHIKKKEEI